MSKEPDKREHSTKPEVDDLTDYQSLNSLGGAGVKGSAEETVATSGPEKQTARPKESEAVIHYSGDYNDGAELDPVDNEGKTNS